VRAAALRRDAYVTPRSPSARHVRRGPAPIRATWRARSPRGRGERKPQFPPAPDFTRRECNPVCRRASPSGLPRPGPRGPSHSRWAPPLPSGARTVPTRHALHPHAVGTAPWSPHVRPGSVPTFLRPHSLPPRPHSLLEGSWTHASAAGGRRRCPPSWPTERQPLSERSRVAIIFILLLFCII
jgi:hypothetical protein